MCIELEKYVASAVKQMLGKNAISDTLGTLKLKK